MQGKRFCLSRDVVPPPAAVEAQTAAASSRHLDLAHGAYLNRSRLWSRTTEEMVAESSTCH